MSNSVARRRSLGSKIAWTAATVVVLLALLVAFFPWDMLRGPINRLVSEKTGRKFEITRHLDVRLGWRTATIVMDGLSFANPEWAREPYLVKADKLEADLRYWSLIGGDIEIPRIVATAPVVGLQMQPDGRRTWAFDNDRSGSGNGKSPKIGVVRIDRGVVNFLDEKHAVDLKADVDFDTGSGGRLPLRYSIDGKYQAHSIHAEGRTGDAMQISQAEQPPFPFEIDAWAGPTRLKANGTVARLSNLDGIDAKFEIMGQSLGNLYELIGVSMPETSPYQLSGTLGKEGKTFKVDNLNGKLGLSDLSGKLTFDQSSQPPVLSGAIASKVLDMDDLGPLIGLPPTERSAGAIDGVKPPPTIGQVLGAKPSKVLPTATLDFERLRAVNADITYEAKRISNVRQLPLDSGNLHLKLQDMVLTLDPLSLGVAGGKIAGSVRIDAHEKPAQIATRLDVRALQINRMIPKVETLKTSFGKLDGKIDLSGRGISVASWLGASSGEFSLLTGRGEFSNLLLELMGLDAGEAIKFLVSGDHNVQLRCAAFYFDVKKGVMQGRTLLFDTTDTVFYGSGDIDLGSESLDLVIKQEPKDMSILSLRTPIVIKGSLASPKPSVEIGPLAQRGVAALVLGAINPLLSLLATVETGPGKDADCRGAIEAAKNPRGAAARTLEAANRTDKKATPGEAKSEAKAFSPSLAAPASPDNPLSPFKENR
ncbi:MAG: AsmA family protein [Variovorax sp.]